MRVIIKKSAILNGIKFCNNMIGQNIIYPILQSILTDIKNNSIDLTDSCGISSSIYIISEGIQISEEGNVIIKARTLLNIIPKLDDEDDLLDKLDNSLLNI